MKSRLLSLITPCCQDVVRCTVYSATAEPLNERLPILRFPAQRLLRREIVSGGFELPQKRCLKGWHEAAQCSTDISFEHMRIHLHYHFMYVLYKTGLEYV
jgi:hypothetical protein